jgi:O-antigen/teichoic acid export membrane protein
MRVESRQLLGSVSALPMGKLLGDAFLFVTIVVLSRLFGEVGIGRYAFAIGYTGFFASFSDYGLSTLTVKELGREDASTEERVNGLFTLRLLLSVLVFILLMVSLTFVPIDAEDKPIVALIGAYQILQRNFAGMYAVLVGRRRSRAAALLYSGQFAGIALAVACVALISRNFVVTIATFPVMAFGQVIIAYLLVHPRLRITSRASTLKGLYRESHPYGLGVLVTQVNSRTDIVLLGFLVGAAASGIYSVAYQLAMLPLSVPIFAALALLPVGSGIYARNGAGLGDLYRAALNWTSLISIPAALGLWLIAPLAISTVFGPEFAKSATVVRVLAIVLFLGSLSRVMSPFLIAADRQVTRTKILWTTAAVNVACNLVLIPQLGALGAALALTVSEGLLAVLYATSLRDLLGWPPISRRVFMSTVASLAFFVPLQLLDPLPLLVILPIAVVIYFAAISCFKEIRSNEFTTLRTVLRKSSD